jgi:hypothetical protein
MQSVQDDGAILHYTAYIPSEKAQVGKVLDIDINGETIRGFVVKLAGLAVTLDDTDRGRENLKRFRWVLGK